ncbi:AAA family ATPase [Pseudonocardia sp. TRM90224]|uniref:AAA family ATPase n=1 Tax=Pseudonocardia sp. TRM90224 TaxID=2812678 RepID=UPI001E3E679E|nr:AAA family ATPase [Pseudonocardia sp. TRM90224]
MKVLITGMSGTGKSTVLEELARRGHRVVDTDSDTWCEWVTDDDGEPDWVWRTEAMAELLATDGGVFVAGCKTNQVDFYPRFDHIVLLSAPADVLFDRIEARTTNQYGKSAEERELVLKHIAEVQPLLREGATLEIDATAPVAAVADQLERLR